MSSVFIQISSKRSDIYGHFVRNLCRLSEISYKITMNVNIVNSNRLTPPKKWHDSKSNRVELQWLEYLWNHVIMFETEVVRANEC